MRPLIKMNSAPRKGLGAFMPAPYGATTPAASSQGVLRVEGNPGTVRVASPPPAALDDGELGGPYNQPSRVVPDFILPCIYTAHLSATKQSFLEGGFTTVSSNVTPVPAGRPGATPGQTQYQPRIGGQTTTAWPRQYVTWPTYGGPA